MESNLNVARLGDLLANLHEITHLQISLHDTTGRELYSARSRSAFCDLICDSQQGYLRCLACDRHAAASFAPPFAPVQYRCHAGLIDTAIPITEGGQLIAIILFGQILDDTPLVAQWAITKKLCTWHPRQKELEEAFLALPRLSVKQIRACYQIINACVSEIRLEGLLKAGTQTDDQRLMAYIHTHYAQPLSLASVAHDLSISKSKLYVLAAQIEPGLTVNAMITRRRIDMAKQLLGKPGAMVREVAEQVGIPDYNYFAKVFKKATGMTPSQFRKES